MDRRGIARNGITQQTVKLPRRDTHPRLFKEHLAVIEQRFDVFARLPRDKGNRRIAHRAKRIVQITHPLVGGHRLGHRVPFIHDQDAWLVILADIIAKLLVDLANPLGRVQKQEHHVRPANTPLGAVRSIKVDRGPSAFRSANARRINRHKRFAVELKPHVDTVACRAGDFAHDHSLRLGQRIHKRAFPYVATTHDRHLHFRLGGGLIGSTFHRGGQPLQNQIQEHGSIAILLGADRRDLPAP